MQDAREQLLSVSLELCRLGLNRGTSGNVSLRLNDDAGNGGLLITPSGLLPQKMALVDMVWMGFDGQVTGRCAPSSEWRFHFDILKQRAEVNAVIHTHSMYSTSLSTLRQDVPAFHYMVAVAGGDSIRCASYALFGSQELSDHALLALKNRKACLLANHGMIALGNSIENALGIAIEVETLCEQYLHAMQVGNPHLLTQQEMQEVQERFKGYGSWAENTSGSTG
ncbi:MAG: class II aldolase [Betaproteobacteria bacterium HGW-Betaproteobacteria-22]|nr:MAG: class II aldolase [Betaproteobacteria bacterium HGW-Betaproteobacteria-22]